MTTDNTRLKAIKRSAKPQDMFYVPETKDALDSWLKAMPNEMPTGIAMMVGYNYAMHQVSLLASGTHPSQQEDEANG